MRSIEIKLSLPSLPGKIPGRFSFTSTPTRTASTSPTARHVLRQMVWDAREVTTALAEMASEFWSGILTQGNQDDRPHWDQVEEIQPPASRGYSTSSSHSPTEDPSRFVSKETTSDTDPNHISHNPLPDTSPTSPSHDIRRMALEKARDTLFDLPEEVIPDHYIAVIQGFDPTTGKTRLFTRADESAPVWLHLGMLDPITEDIRDALRD